MRLLLDENLSHRIVTQLQDAGHDAVHVSSVGLTDTADDVIFAWASREDRVVVTADADFGEMLALVGAVAPSVVRLRSADHLTPSEQGELIIAAIDEVGEDLEAVPWPASGPVAFGSVRYPSSGGTTCRTSYSRRSRPLQRRDWFGRPRLARRHGGKAATTAGEGTEPPLQTATRETARRVHGQTSQGQPTSPLSTPKSTVKSCSASSAPSSSVGPTWPWTWGHR